MPRRIVLLIAGLVLAWGGPGSTPGLRAQDLPVAIAGPLTGQLAALGEQMKRGADLFVGDSNAKGGVLGRKLALTAGDDQCDPKQAVAVANQLAAKHVAIVVGHACSGSSIPASDVYAEEGVLMITPASTNPTLTDRGPRFKNVFRTIGRDDKQGSFAGDYMAKTYHDKKIAIVHDKSAYGKGLADEAKAALNRGGVKEVAFEAINAGEKDFTALVSKLKSLGAAVVYLGGYHPEAGLIVRQAREQGAGFQLIGGDALNTSEFAAIAGPAGDGTLFTFAPDARKLPAGRAVAERFKAQGFDPEGYTLYTYAAFQVFAAAAAKAQSIKLDALETALRADRFDTVVGALAFDAKGDITEPRFEFYVWRGGKYEAMP